MSANAFVEDIMNSKIAGMNMHLAKPLDETKLINALKQCKKDERVSDIHLIMCITHKMRCCDEEI